MPMEKSDDFGTNIDKSKNKEYCKFCYQNGDFTLKVGMKEYIEHLVKIAVENRGMTEAKARAMGEKIIPKLKRWR